MHNSKPVEVAYGVFVGHEWSAAASPGVPGRWGSAGDETIV